MRLPERDIQRMCQNLDCNKTFGVANRFDDRKFCDPICKEHMRWIVKKAKMALDRSVMI